MNVEIETSKKQTAPWAEFTLFRLGFRPFFTAAAMLAVFTMLIWMAELIFSVRIIAPTLTLSAWHGHEMIYGYGLAVIAGFLLTAVKNWTGVQTLSGLPLQGLLLLWALARISPLFPNESMLLLGLICDGLFIVALSVALTVPVVQAKKWKNMGVVSKLYFFLPGHVLYSLDVLGLFSDGQRLGLYIGLYMTLSLLLVLSRRVIPMFIERGLDEAVSLKNYLWVDIACFALFLLFAVLDIFFDAPTWVAVLAFVLAVLHGFRLWGWYAHGIWKRPLLWVLYMAYAWIVLAFCLKAVAFWGGSEFSFLALHAFAVGGMGMMTLGMMSRVSLGHTGRDMKQPPKGLAVMFALLMTAACVRVIFPMIFVGYDLLWVGLSQGLWIVTFVLFLYHYMPMLISPRIDGKWG